MFPVYEEKKENLHFRSKTSRHASPHLHNSIEFIYITEGTLELGMGQELYHMDKGDFAVIFPDVIHHYQVFSPGINRGWYLWAGMTLTGQFADTLQKSCPDNPVITSKNLHPDIRNAVKCLYDNKKRKDTISLYAPIGEDKDGNEIKLCDVIEDPSPSISERIVEDEQNKLIQEAVNKLTGREYEIICRRFGLNGFQAETQREIAKSMGISRSYVSRIEKRVLTKLYLNLKEHN